MINVSVFILYEDAGARLVFALSLSHLKIVVYLAFGEIFFREGCLIIVVEVGAAGRYPVEVPAHPLLIGLDLGQGCARDCDKADIMMFQMQVSAIYVIG